MNRRQFAVSSVAGLAGFTYAVHAIAQDKLATESQPTHRLPATPVSAPTIYDGDIRDMWARPWVFENVFAQFQGVVEQIRVAPPGEGFLTGEEGSEDLYRSQVTLTLGIDGLESDQVLAAIHIDIIDIYPGDTVEVIGKPQGMHIEPARGGGYWPYLLVIANSITKVDLGTPEASDYNSNSSRRGT